MNRTTALQAGLRRGAIELRQTFTNLGDLWNYVCFPVLVLVVMFFLRGTEVPGTGFSLGAMAIPGVLGMLVAFSGLTTPAYALMSEREDGTLLRMKATPNGMSGYLVGKTVTVIGMSLPSLAVLLVPSAFLFEGLRLGSPGAWFTLAWVLALGLAATMPVGAVLGSLFSSPSSLGLLSVLMLGLVAISGVFYPIIAFPVWLQWIAQFFPIYWLGLGTRSALLPGPMAAVEIGESWRHLETLGVLGIWAVVGLVLTPIVLRRVARRESGSAVDARRGKTMQQRLG